MIAVAVTSLNLFVIFLWLYFSRKVHDLTIELMDSESEIRRIRRRVADLEVRMNVNDACRHLNYSSAKKSKAVKL